MVKINSKKSNILKSNKKNWKIVVGVLTILLILLIFILLVDSNLISNPLDSFNKEIKKIEVKDSCAIIAGKKINPINNEGTCHNICFAECDSLKGNLMNSSFIYGENACNKCTCNCKI